MITRFEAQGYRCLKDVVVDVQPLHAFIGPNDSGKSTLLAALARAVSVASNNAEWSAQISASELEGVKLRLIDSAGVREFAA